MDYYDEVVELTSTNRASTSINGSSKNIIAGNNIQQTVAMAETTMNIADGAAPKAPLPKAKDVAEAPAFVKMSQPKIGEPSAAKPARSQHALTDDSNDASETDESSGESAAHTGQPTFHIDHKQWEHLDVAAELKELFQYTLRYSPSKVHIDYVLQPFVPEFIPAVGDIDAFLKVLPPPLHTERRAETMDWLGKLGVETLDEPAGQQSEPALLHMKLRSVSTHLGGAAGNRGAGSGDRGGSGAGGGVATPGSRGGGGGGAGVAAARLPLVPIARKPKDVDKWIHEMQQLHLQQTPYPVQQQLQLGSQRAVADIDALMMEWPAELERALGAMGFPPAHLDCSLEQYVRLVCGLLDIALPPPDGQQAATQADYICALNTLFNLYMAVKQQTV